MNNETYWSNKGRYQKLAEQLEKLIPFTGEVEDAKNNPKLEKFRMINNAYYDLYNNGGINNDTKFVSKYFPKCMSLADKSLWDQCEKITEPIVDKAVIAASVEQGILEG